MKKTYIKPTIEVYNIVAVQMLASSFDGGVGGGEKDPDEGNGPLGRDDNNGGGNLWDQVW